MVGCNRREENSITHLKIHHTALSHTPYKTGKHPTGKCTHCSQSETAEHVLTQCNEDQIERNHLIQSASQAKHHGLSPSDILAKTAGKLYSHIFNFLKEMDGIK